MILEIGSVAGSSLQLAPSTDAVERSMSTLSTPSMVPASYASAKAARSSINWQISSSLVLLSVVMDMVDPMV